MSDALKFPIGRKVKIIASTYSPAGAHLVGQEGIISENDPSDNTYYVEASDGVDDIAYAWFNESDLEDLTTPAVFNTLRDQLLGQLHAASVNVDLTDTGRIILTDSGVTLNLQELTSAIVSTL